MLTQHHDPILVLEGGIEPNHSAVIGRVSSPLDDSSMWSHVQDLNLRTPLIWRLTAYKADALDQAMLTWDITSINYLYNLSQHFHYVKLFLEKFYK